jgi:Tol biopolymer transport system component
MVGQTDLPTETVISSSTPSPNPTSILTLTPTKTELPLTPISDPKITINPSLNSIRDQRDLIAFKDFDETEDTVTIFLVHQDGTSLTKLVTLSGDLLRRGYSWSHDGNQIAFSHAPQERFKLKYLDYFQIYTIDIYSGDLHRVTNGLEDHTYPVWSPDGHRITFFSGPEYLLSIADIDGSEERYLSTDPRIGRDYSWSPEGTRIAYEIGDPPFNFSIWLMDANGENAHQFETEYLDFGTEYNYTAIPEWMPDGDHLVFLKQHDLYYGDIAGKSSTRLTFTIDYPELWFDVSPNGSMIAYINNDGEDIYLTIIDLQGNFISEERIGTFEVDFDWSPDCKAVVFTMNNSLWVYYVDGQYLVKLFDCPGMCRDPQWQP